MIALWMVHALWVGTLVVVAAALFERGARLLGLPVRWVWVAAACALPVLMLASPERPAPAPPSVMTVGVTAAGAMPAAAEARGRATLLTAARAALGAPLRGVAAATDAATRRAAGRVLVAFWLLASGALLVLAAATQLRVQRERRGWRSVELDGVAVRVALRTGPAVVGLLRAEIVVPEWLLASPARERRLVLAHESEHLRAGDNALLALACLLVVLAPWHPAIWWLARRLRLAVELDCDARVLRRGADAAAYGTLLLAMGGRSSFLPFAAPALAETTTHLERRILAMTHRTPRFARARGGTLVLCAAALAAAACETRLPTSPEIEALDVAAAEQHAERIGILSDERAQYYVDGAAVDAAEARRLAVEQIASIEVLRRGSAAGDGEPVADAAAIRITTRQAAVRSAALDEQAAGSVRVVPVADGFEGILVIDGAVVPASSLRRLSPDDIETIEIVKGPAAAQIYTDPAARNGVLRIVTRRAAATP